MDSEIFIQMPISSYTREQPKDSMMRSEYRKQLDENKFWFDSKSKIKTLVSQKGLIFLYFVLGLQTALFIGSRMFDQIKKWCPWAMGTLMTPHFKLQIIVCFFKIREHVA